MTLGTEAGIRGPSGPDPASDRRILGLRLAVGLGQGIATWGLTRQDAWLAAHPALFSALLLLTAFIPLILLAGLGRMRPAILLSWSAAAGLLVIGWALYGTWRDPDTAPQDHAGRIAGLAAVALYVAHHLIEAADEARRWRPPYAAMVDGAWRHAFQLALALAFVGVLWGVLQLGGALFDLIGIRAIGRVVREGWFAWPVLGVAFAGAVHLTDVRPGMIEGVRSVALTLLAWLLSVAAGLLAAFLLALLATGLHPLWSTGRSAALLLGAVALLVVLVNAAYQDGRRPELLPGVIRWSGRLAGVILALLTVLAAWALILRTGQYGLTPARVYGLAATGVAAVYAGGYLWAAIARGPWMRPLETVNVAASMVVFATILLLLSPVLDPARLSADDQVRRLESGRTTTPDADLAFLRSGAARFGRDALARLAASSDAALAAKALAAEGESAQARPPPGPAFAQAHIRPEGQVLPQDFRDQHWTREEEGYGAAACLADDTPCDIVVGDLNGDGSTDVIVYTRDLFPQLFARGSDGRWVHRGYWDGSGCPGAAEALDAGRVRSLKPEVPDLAAGGVRLTFHVVVGGCTPAPAP